MINDYPYKIKIRLKLKRCSKCHRLLIACKLNFVSDKTKKDGFYSSCKICQLEYRNKHREEINVNQRERLKNNPEYKEKQKQCAKKYREEHKEEIAEYMKQWQQEHKEERQEYNKKYYQDNKNELDERKRQWNAENREKRNTNQRERYKNDKEFKEKCNKASKQWADKNPDKLFNSRQKRRSKIEDNGEITREQWKEMFEFFDWCCAYSGEYLGGANEDKRRTVDHVIPLDKGGSNEPWNCVPMEKGYNCSKRNKDMIEWYTQQEFYSEERLQKIKEWQEYAKNKWKNN